MTINNIVLKVALPVPLNYEFEYLLPDGITIDDSPVGRRVEVPLGARQHLVGIVVEVAATSAIAREKLRAIDNFLDESPVIDHEILSLCRWCADYYLYSLGEVLQLALPALLRRPAAIPQQRQQCWRLSAEGRRQVRSDFGRAHKQCLAWELLRQQPSTAAISTDKLRAQGIGTTVLKSLASKGLVEKVEVTSAITNAVTVHAREKPEPPLTLNRQQQQALDSLDFSTFGCYLLEGITGSGKTEVYLQAIDRVTAKGGQALILVPEIGLTPQTLERFQRRFDVPMVLMHSGLSERERYFAWMAGKQRRAVLMIGTRSSIFCPLPQLGLIIVDEEHDASYKQQEGVHYSARDLAVVRAQKCAIPLILGSATPSLETLRNALHGRYHHLVLNRRASGAELAAIEAVDNRGADLAGEILAAINRCIADNQQVLVFINRRGYAPTLLCRDCGWVSECRRCDSKMTLHHHPHPHLHCHHCDDQIKVPVQCPLCHSVRLEPIGQGTQRSEEQLLKQFPQVPILRIDSDTTRRKAAMKKMMDTVNGNNACILVGTQILAKGHHFPKVTLVVVLGIDACLFSGAFRGSERMGQLLIQVAGRAGRGKYPGRVLLQTQFGDHPLLQLLINQGYQSFSRRLLMDRKSAAMPPYHHMACIRCHAQQPDIAINFLTQARHCISSLTVPPSQIRIVGPIPALLEKRNNRYHYQLQVLSELRQDRDRLLTRLYGKLEKLKQPRGLQWIVDIDPQEY